MAERRQIKGSGRLTVNDWIDAASQVIADHGVVAVAVEPLAQRLGVTKGSFYWHFPNRDALLQATLERWEQEDTEAAIAALAAIEDPRERLERLIARALADGPHGGDDGSSRVISVSDAVHLALSDAADHPIVQPVLRRVSERRIDYLDECFRALGLPSDAARFRALLAYSAYLGVLRLFREAPSRLPTGSDSEAFRHHLVSTLVG